MRRLWLGLLVGLTGCGYSHIAETRGTFQQAGNALSLQVYRHLDTVISGPDFEEDQRLVLEIAEYEIGKRIPVPSARVKVSFDVTRFGPSSEGTDFTGYVVVKKVMPKQLVVNLQLDVTAQTRNGRYTQRAKFRGDHTFFRGEP